MGAVSRETATTAPGRRRPTRAARPASPADEIAAHTRGEPTQLFSDTAAPPSGGRRLFEPDKPHELSEGAQEARRLLGAAPRELGGLPDEGRELFEKKADCEDSADELAAKIFEDGGAAYRSCAEAKEAGWCGDELAQNYCAASCGWCDTSCEDSADEVVQQLSQEALGRTLSLSLIHI